MIITKTPFRMSFFGGGTDIPEFFREHGGAVLLGLRGPVIKCHGNASRKEIRNAVLQAKDYVDSGVGDLIAAAIAEDAGKETNLANSID